MIELVKNKSECCGCAGCSSVCPKNAITMVIDEYGFEYPSIDDEKCIECGLCTRTCEFQNHVNVKNMPMEVYASYNKDVDSRMVASSGGIFELIADSFLDKGGYVCGAILEFVESGNSAVYHSITNQKSDIQKMCGSKYVQSDMKSVYNDIKGLLKNNEKVLFSGTPCQVAEVKKYTAECNDNLFTFEILCHGVPSITMFRDLIRYLNDKLHGTISSFRFRDKTLNWGHNVELIYKKDSKYHKKVMAGNAFAYCSFFLKSLIIRPSCFSCPYVGENRQGDITAGDYWGIGEFHSELKNQMKNGISCVLVNSEKGKSLLQGVQQNIESIESDLENIKKYNGSLKTANKCTDEYYSTMEIYSKSGYEGLEKLYKKKMGKKWYQYQIKAMIPPNIKKIIRLLVKK